MLLILAVLPVGRRVLRVRIGLGLKARGVEMGAGVGVDAAMGAMVGGRVRLSLRLVGRARLMRSRGVLRRCWMRRMMRFPIVRLARARAMRLVKVLRVRMGAGGGVDAVDAGGDGALRASRARMLRGRARAIATAMSW
jgi:hypothetical protein